MKKDFVLNKWLGPVLFVAIIPFAALIENGVITAAFGLGFSVLLIVIAAVWSMLGREKLKNLGELYLWLSFILSVYHFQFLADWFAKQFAVESIEAFRIVAMVHFVVVIAILGKFGAWSFKALANNESSQPARIAAGFFILGAVIFWVGARTFQGMALDVIAANTAGNLWTSVNFIVATVVTLFGLAFFTITLENNGDRFLAKIGLLSYAFGAVFWVLHLAFRLTVLNLAAQEWSVTSAAPAWFEPWRAWAAVLFALYSILAYIGLAAFGGAILKTAFMSRWIGWMCMGFGVIAGFLGGLPLFIHVPLWIIGILTLRESASAQKR